MTAVRVLLPREIMIILRVWLATQRAPCRFFLFTPPCIIMPSTLLLLYIYVLIHSLLAFAQPMNRTIDDTYGDLVTQLQVVYSSNWHAGQDCSVCAVSPSEAQAYAGTWHDTTSDNPNSTTSHTATLLFNGLSHSLAHYPEC